LLVLANQALKAPGIGKQLRIARALRSAESLNRPDRQGGGWLRFGNQLGANVTVQRRPQIFASVIRHYRFAL